MLPPYKIVVLGDLSVGKTLLVHRFTTNEFNGALANTIGAAFITKPYDKVKLEIWDTAGQERYRSLTPMYYRNLRVALVCYDLSAPDSFDRAKYWIEQLRLHNDSLSAQPILIVLVGTKADLGKHVEEAEEFSRIQQLKLVKTSALTGEGILAMFDDIVNEIPESFLAEFREELQRLEPQPKQACC